MNWGLFVALDDVVEISSKCLAYIVLMDIGIDEVAGFIVKLPHAALGIFYTAIGLGIGHKFADFIGTDAAVFHLVSQLSDFGGRIVVHSVDGGQRELAFSHVVAGGFAYVRAVVIVEDVVAYLEDYTEVLAEAGSSLNLLVGGSRRQRTNGGTRLEERSGLTFIIL